MIKTTKLSDIKRSWHLIDAKGKILGRMATEIALLLVGKNKPYFVRNLDCGDYVVVINAKEVAVSGKKEELKIYTHYSGYPAGLSKEPLGELRKRLPDQIVRRAVNGMLPNNKLRDRMQTRLFIFKDENHTYKDKFKK